MAGSITPVKGMRRQLTSLHAVKDFERMLREGVRDFSYRKLDFPQALSPFVADINDYTYHPETRRDLASNPIDFRYSVLNEIAASGIILPYTLFNQAYLTDGQFDSSDLTGAVFGATDINGADFSEAVLDEADFRHIINLGKASGFDRLKSYNGLIVNSQDLDLFIFKGLDKKFLDVR